MSFSVSTSAIRGFFILFFESRFAKKNGFACLKKKIYFCAL